MTAFVGSDVAIPGHRRKACAFGGNAVLRETNPSVSGVRQPGKPEVSGRRDAAEREHLHLGVSMAAARQRTTRAAKSPCSQVDSRDLYIDKCERCWPTA